jgi:hypothetical protein
LFGTGGTVPLSNHELAPVLASSGNVLRYISDPIQQPQYERYVNPHASEALAELFAEVRVAMRLI